MIVPTLAELKDAPFQDLVLGIKVLSTFNEEVKLIKAALILYRYCAASISLIFILSAHLLNEPKQPKHISDDSNTHALI